MATFLDERRLMSGPWRAFERDIGRMLIANAFEDVRIVGGSGDRGADVLGVKRGELWVVQAKHTTNTPPPRSAIEEVVEAGAFYRADRMLVACSRHPGQGILEERDRFAKLGIKVEVMGPAKLQRAVEEAPTYARCRRSLRPYQVDAVEAFKEALISSGKAQVVLATGLGKTVVMAETVAELYRESRIEGGRTLVLAHTRDIVDQLHQSFWSQLPKTIPTHRLEGGEVPTFWDGITFATIQSVLGRVDDLPRFGLVLVDEAHHVGSDTFLQAISALSPPMLGGATATPWRGDGFDIDRLLGPAVVQIGIEEGLRRGFLSEVDYRLLADNVDWEVVKDLSRHKYSLAELNRRLIIPTRDEEAARILRESFDKEGRRAGIVFSPTTVHAQHMAAMLRSFDLRSEAIVGELAPRERDRLMSAFRRGDLDVVTSVDLFNEGVDVPDVDVIAFMRVTHSRRIFVQQLGRGLRVSPRKDKVMVLDFVSDLRRIAEVIRLDGATRTGESPIERLGLGESIVSFHDASAGSFVMEWLRDQADLLLREGDPALELPRFDFPEPVAPGGVQ
jgi:superfamily II DNA or RNA helicase